MRFCRYNAIYVFYKHRCIDGTVGNEIESQLWKSFFLASFSLKDEFMCFDELFRPQVNYELWIMICVISVRDQSLKNVDIQNSFEIYWLLEAMLTVHKYQ